MRGANDGSTSNHRSRHGHKDAHGHQARMLATATADGAAAGGHVRRKRKKQVPHAYTSFTSKELYLYMWYLFTVVPKGRTVFSY